MATFDVTTNPTSLTIKPGTTGSVFVVISNRLGRPVMGLVEGALSPASAAKWIVPPADLQRRYEADPAATVNYEFKIAVPPDAAPQTAQFKASVRDVLSPDDTRVEGQTVTINVSPKPVVAKEEGRQMPWWVWAAAAVVVLGVGFGIYAAVRPKGVPDVVGMVSEDASEKLHRAGFGPVGIKDTVEENADADGVNRVVRQDPKAKSKLPSGGEKGTMPATIVVNRQKVVERGSRAVEHISQAIATLGNTSQGWQSVLAQLEQQLRQDAEPNLAGEVSQIASKGTAAAGTEIRCTADFVRQRMRLDLQRVAARLKDEPVPKIEPAYCDVAPKSLAIGQLPGPLEYYGYDLNAPDGNVQVVLRHAGGEDQLGAYLTYPAHYLMRLDLTAAPLCNKENRQILLRLNGGERAAVPITKFQCPRAADPPPPAARQLLSSHLEEMGGGIGGVSTNREYGTRCTPGYVRQQCRVVREAGDGACSMEGQDPRTHVQLGWVDNDETNALCRVHYGIRHWVPGEPDHFVKCRIEIFEVGVQQPRAPDPPCPCW